MNRDVIRDYILFGIGVCSIIGGVYIAIQDPGLARSTPGVSALLESIERVVLVAGVVIVLGVITVLLLGVFRKPDQPLITTEEPEVSYTSELRTHNETEFKEAYETALKWFEKEENTRDKKAFFKNRVGMYGYQMQQYEGLPSEIESLFEQVQDVISEVYAAETGCDIETARKRIKTGEWSDSIAAQFISETGFESNSFSIFDRLNAWLSPKETFRDRIDAVMDEAMQLEDG